MNAQEIKELVKENATVVCNQHDLYFYASISIDNYDYIKRGTCEGLAIANLTDHILEHKGLAL